MRKVISTFIVLILLVSCNEDLKLASKVFGDNLEKKGLLMEKTKEVKTLINSVDANIRNSEPERVIRISEILDFMDDLETKTASWDQEFVLTMSLDNGKMPESAISAQQALIKQQKLQQRLAGLTIDLEGIETLATELKNEIGK
jgi:hypothetical protein